MMMLPENRVGYLFLHVDRGNVGEKDKILVKASHIKVISLIDEDAIDIAPWARSVVYTDSDENFFVYETMDEIIEQLGNIHPSLL